MSAGLPHFSVGWARCWGRDTFISFKGLLLIPRYFALAKNIIIMYASVVNHGLIPNLHSKGIHARYNARDATWFFIKSVIDYVEISQDFSLFDELIPLQFPQNNM